MPYRIIVGPEAMYVERNGVQSEVRDLTDDDNAASIKTIASELWGSIRPFVAWAAWWRHRFRMAHRRRLTTLVQNEWPGPYYSGPRPDLVANQPWRHVKKGEWTILPHGVVARLIRKST